MTKKKKALIVLPWVLLLVMCVAEVRARWKDWELKWDLRKHGNIYGMIEETRFLGDWGPFEVAAFRTSAGDKESVQILAFGEIAFFVETDPMGDKNNLTFSVVRRSDLETILQCGSKEGVFPAYIVVTPQNGPDAHTIMVGDYDMDGVFEKRMPATGIGSPPADDQDE